MVPASPREEAASLHLCVSCQAPLESALLSPHLCGACGFPQPLRNEETPFTLLGALPRFQQDEAVLRSRFYALSRALHPDRFAAATADARMYSIERMSRVNEAFRILRDRKLLREAILSLFEVGDQVKTPGVRTQEVKGAPPVELAEAWFELQDAVMDDPSCASDKIRQFESHLNQVRSAAEAQILEQEQAFDRSESQDRVALLEISRILRELAYLDSMVRDVVRLKSRFIASPTSALG